MTNADRSCPGFTTGHIYVQYPYGRDHVIQRFREPRRRCSTKNHSRFDEGAVAMSRLYRVAIAQFELPGPGGHQVVGAVPDQRFAYSPGAKEAHHLRRWSADSVADRRPNGVETRSDHHL